MNYQTLSVLGTTLLLAFLGSWHCAAMCGPIALALSRQGSVKFYHWGRALSYIGSGAIAGFLGHGLFHWSSPSFRWIGALLLSSFFLIPFLQHSHLKNLNQRIFQSIFRQRKSPFLFGLASVFLPCGWLWTFIAAAAATGSAWAGSLVMACLWFSSLPALTAITAYFHAGLQRASLVQTRWMTYGITFAGIYSIWSHFFFH